MKRKNTTRNTLVTSVISLLLCVSMLVGATFAWFTDEVKSGMNSITAGNLDIEVTNDEGKSIQNVEELFADITLWEPGVVAYENLHVSNEGTLALQYDLKINFANQNYVTDNGLGLADVLKVAVIDGAVTSANREELVNSIPAEDWTLLSDLTESGELYPEGTANEISEKAFAIVIWWEPSDKDNQWNVNNGRTTSDGEPLHIDLGIHVFATQMMYEEDSFGNNYDEMLPKAGLQRDPSKEDVTIQWGSYGQWSPTYPNDQTLEAVYVFTAPHDGTTVQDSKYKDWYCDFVVSLDRDTTDTNDVGDLFLGGNYGIFDWVGFEAPAGIPANEEVALLGSVTTVRWTYEDIATNVGTFVCGVGRTHDSDMSKLDGATFTVKLQLTNPETSEVFTVAEVKYTFSKKASTVAELKDLLAAGQNVILTQDITINEPLAVPAGEDVVLDLGGHTLAAAFDNQGSSALITNNGELTLRNGTVASLAEFPDVDWGTEGFPTYATNTISNRGKLVVEAGAKIINQTNVGGASYAVDNYDGATLIVNGGTIMAKDVAIRMFSGSATIANSVIINSGVITGKRAIWIQLPSNNSAVAPLTVVDINGGELYSTSDLTIYSYSYGNSFAQTTVTFNGGFFEKDVAFGGGYKGDKEIVNVNGGTFNGALGRYVEDDGTNGGWVDIAKP